MTSRLFQILHLLAIVLVLMPFFPAFVGESAHGAVPPALTHEKGIPVEFDTLRTDPRDYIWPTDASTRITSSFAEYRTTHFHGGIDISTNAFTPISALLERDAHV